MAERRRAVFAANDAASESACVALLEKLYMDVVWADLARLSASAPGAAGAPDTDLAGALAETWAELRRRYAAAAVGPVASRAALAFLAEKWPASAHELVRRIEQRHDAAARGERDRLVGLKAQLAEMEGTVAARARMLEDSQHALVSTQLEKARHEARAAAAAKQVADLQRARARDKEAADAKIARLEVALQKAQNDLDAAADRRKATARAGDDPVAAGSKPADTPCSCVVA